MKALQSKIETLAIKFGLEINHNKTKISKPGDEQEIVGVLLHKAR